MSLPLTAYSPAASRPDSQVETYAAAVRAALGDLTDAQRGELLEDLDDHLREVAAEDDRPLVERLGAPDAYAAELRASLGLPEPPAVTSGLVEGALHWLRSATAGVRQTHAWTALAAFLPSLQPAWWLLRAWLLLVVVAALTDAEAYTLAGLMLPRVEGSRLLAALVLAVLVVGSVWRGQRSARLTPAGRTVVVAADLFIAFFAVFAVTSVASPLTPYRYAAAPEQAAQAVERLDDDRRALVNGDGGLVHDIEVRGADGKPLPGPVFLYDQDGVPLDNLAPWWQEPSPELPDGRQLVVRPQLDAAGNLARNYFPRVFDYYDPETGGVRATAVPVVPGEEQSSPNASPTPERSPDAPARPTPEPTPEPTPGPTPATAPDAGPEPDSEPDSEPDPEPDPVDEPAGEPTGERGAAPGPR